MAKVYADRAYITVNGVEVGPNKGKPMRGIHMMAAILGLSLSVHREETEEERAMNKMARDIGYPEPFPDAEKVKRRRYTESKPVEPTPVKATMPLDMEEEATLATLSGKAKKAYVKLLKAKYS